MNTRQKAFSIISLVVLIAFIALGTIIFWQLIANFKGDPELLRQYIASFGEGYSAFIFLGIQILQIIFPILPGEVIELGAGYMFGAVYGLLLCELGILCASLPIFLLGKKFGHKLISAFISKEKLESLKFLQNEKRLSLITFIVFLLPGTPKDVFTYFLGLTPLKTIHFALITTVARIPSIITSTIVGANLGDNGIDTAIIVYAVYATVSALGYLAYKKYLKVKQNS